MPATVVNLLAAHLDHSPADGPNALVFPDDDALLTPTALYGRASRVETRNGRTYAKAAYGFYAAPGNHRQAHPSLA